MTDPGGVTWGPLAARPRWRRRVPAGRAFALSPLSWLLVVLGLLLVGALAWLAVTGLMARSALSSARADLESMRAHVSAGDTSAATADARAFRRHAHRAHTLTTGPAWFAAASIPRLGSPARTVRGSTAAVDDVANRVVDPIVGVLVGIDPSRIIGTDGTVDTTPLTKAAPVLADATAAAAESRASVATLPGRTWLHSVDTARGSLLQELDRLHTTLGLAGTTARIAPDMLGATTPKRYFVGLLNTAEARGLGGLPGAFVILVADHGRLRITHYESDTALAGLDSRLDLGAEYVTRYGLSAPTKTYVNSTISPHLPYAARIWAALWQQKSGERIDGAVTVDPTALGYLLDVTGPARLPGGEKVTGKSVVRLTEHDVYERYPNGKQRKDFLLEIARAVDSKILRGSSRPTAFLKAAGRAVGERRLLLWSANASSEQALAGLPIGGTLPLTGAPFSMMTVTNAAGGKLDYYLDRRLRWASTGCGAQRQVTVTAVLTNSAPTGLPAYVVIRADHPRYSVKPGDNRVLLDYFATQGAQLRALTVDGRAVTVRTSTERGHPVFTVDLELPRGVSRTVTLVMTEPGHGPPLLVTQPLVRPMSTSVDVGACR